MNEDEYTLHIMMAGDQIRSFSKADLKTVERPAESFMPSYRSTLGPGEVDDILSYLCTLRGNQ